MKRRARCGTTQTWKFAPGTYDYVCIAPIARANFEPDVIAVYGNSAQVMRMVNAALFKRGGRIESTTGGRLDSLDPESFQYEVTSREIPSANG